MFNPCPVTGRILGTIALLVVFTAQAGAALSPDSPRRVAPVGQRILIVDDAVTDSERLIGEHPGYSVVRLVKSAEPLQAIAAALAQFQNIDALAVVSHGDDGQLYLGEKWIDQTALIRNVAALRSIRGALNTGASILLYGCDVAATGKGRNEGVQEAILRVAQRAMYDDPRVAGGPDVFSESAR